MAGPTIEPIVLPAKMLADAWLRVWGAASQDEERWTFWRVVNVEVFPDAGVRLWATDSYVMFRSFVPLAAHVDEDGPIYEEPGFNVEPAVTLMVQDRDLLGLGVFSYLAKPPPKDEKGGPLRTVVLSTGRMEDELQPRLGVEVEPWGVLLATPSTRQFVPLLEGAEPSNWRRLHDKIDPSEVAGLSLGASILKAMARLASGAKDGGLAMEFGAPNQPVVIHAACEPPVDGLVMPIRAPAPVPDDDDEPVEAPPPTRKREPKHVEVTVDLDDDDPFAGLDDLAGSSFLDEVTRGD